MPSRTTQLITLHGPDARRFVQAQFASDVLGLRIGGWQWSSWLDPKGKVRALLQIMRSDEETLIVVPRGGDVPALAADLRRFLFRSKLTIAISDPVRVGDGGALTEGDVAYRDDVFVLGEGDASTSVGASAQGSDWYARHIEKGYAWLPDAALDTLLPPALSLERLGAVAFAKGCFPGQEIAARLHFLGGHKKHLRHVRATTALVEGELLRHDGHPIGIVLMHDESRVEPTSLVVLDDAAINTQTVDIDGNRLHVVSTFDA